MALPTRRATPQPKPTRAASKIKPAPAYNSGGQYPLVTIPNRRRSAIAGIVRQPPPWHEQPLRSRIVPAAPKYNSGGLIPTMVAAKQKPKPLRGVSRVRPPAPVYNSGGQAPIRTVGQQAKPRPLRKAPQRFVPPPTVAVVPTKPIVTMGTRQKPPTRAQSKLRVSAPYNGSGIRPLVWRAAQKAQAPTRSRFKYQQQTLPVAPAGTGLAYRVKTREGTFTWPEDSFGASRRDELVTQVEGSQ